MTPHNELKKVEKERSPFEAYLADEFAYNEMMLRHDCERDKATQLCGKSNERGEV